ncbi:Nse1 non-SMC component of SMC5-6 complex-domain-containing protein [Zychaea mexicana]|uniref:Nse1 non-SMC component of SMC5-6 complex-domain-containing protein n=1 Tax=Zychaea mexicana TaxID=64656 RepID=UPI0022FE40E8|nr:Nse1 non-SMC component of SMC5-6 complex-domain-containing protein [Zychaea mexicana]KAI9499309.1 Nse1 non-SMC component of SMC5-6 complex-domain-containing protein [Zychaea mexicana]
MRIMADSNQTKTAASSEQSKDSSSVYNNIHRAFLQAVMNRRIVDADTAEGLYDTILANAEQKDFQEFVLTINLEINNFDLSLRTVRDERTGHAMLLLVNTKSDVGTQGATLYTPSELDYFKHLLDGIMQAPDLYLSSDTALHVASELDIKLEKAQGALDRFVDDHWLYYCVDSGHYALSLRSTVELQRYFEEHHPDAVSFCPTCSELVTVGRQCRQCDTRIHRHCTTGTAISSEACPFCSRVGTLKAFGLSLDSGTDDDGSATTMFSSSSFSSSS